MGKRTPTPAATPKPAAPVVTDEQKATAAQAAAEAAAADEAEQAQQDAEAAAEATIEARILVDHAGFACNTLALLTGEQAKAGERDGWADMSPEAVAYAKSLAD